MMRIRVLPVGGKGFEIYSVTRGIWTFPTNRSKMERYCLPTGRAGQISYFSLLLWNSHIGAPMPKIAVSHRFQR